MDNFKRALIDSTEKIAEQYFETKIIDLDRKTKKVYRERIYCYELYHQIRIRIPNEGEASFFGEYDKSGSKSYDNTMLKGVKPDFSIHIPGDNDNNSIAMEVKSSSASNTAIKIDIKKLVRLVDEQGFRFGIYLIYGENAKIKGNTAIKYVRDNLQSKIIVFAHSKSYEKAELIQHKII